MNLKNSIERVKDISQQIVHGIRERIDTLIHPKPETEQQIIARERREYDDFVAFANSGPKLTPEAEDRIRRELICIALGLRPSKKNIANLHEEVQKRLQEGTKVMNRAIEGDPQLLACVIRAKILIWLFKKSISATNAAANGEPDSVANRLGFPQDLLIGYLQAIFGGITQKFNNRDAVIDLIDKGIDSDDSLAMLFYKLLGLNEISTIDEIEMRCRLFEQRISRFKKLADLPDMEYIQSLLIDDINGELDEAKLQSIQNVPDRTKLDQSSMQTHIPQPISPSPASRRMGVIDRLVLVESSIEKLQAFLERFKTLSQPEASVLRKRINDTPIAQGNDIGDQFFLDKSNDPLRLIREHFRLVSDAELETKIVEIVRQFTEAHIIE
jgi:hypothetical protein